jgi:hypothetical protein
VSIATAFKENAGATHLRYEYRLEGFDKDCGCRRAYARRQSEEKPILLSEPILAVLSVHLFRLFFFHFAQRAR